MGGETQGLINQSMEQFPLDESQANGPEDDDYKDDDDDEESDDAESDELTEISTSELLQSSQTMSEGEVDSQIQEINTMELLERYEGRRRGNALRDHLRQHGQGLNIDQLLNY